MARTKGRRRPKPSSNRKLTNRRGRPSTNNGVQLSENDAARQAGYTAFAGPSRFGREPCVVASLADGSEPVDEEALSELRAGFADVATLAAGAPRATVAARIVARLARLLLPGASLVEGALGLHTWDAPAGELLLDVALGLVREACAGRTPEIPLARLKHLAPDNDELPEQTVLRNAAQKLGVFAHRLDLSNGSALLVLGSGSRQRRLLGLLPDATTFSGALATNKNVACALLARAGLPVPIGETVTTRKEAHAAAKKLGFPVTLKVATGSRQRGVVPCVVSGRALERALDRFCRKREVAVELRLERHVEGAYFRAFVAAGELVACATSPSPSVTGDGRATIRELVAREHDWLEKVLGDRDRELATNARKILEQVLVGHDLAPDSVLAKGRTVPVAFPTSMGYAFDVTHKVHPENAAALVRATRVLGMFWSGIDVQAARIDVPFARQDAAIIEVNDIPAWAFHGNPLEGEGPGVDMPPAILKAFFGARSPNVPVALLVGDERGALDLAKKLRARGVRAVVATGDALDAALDPEADALLLAPSARELVARGLAVPSVDVVLGDVPRAAAAVVANAGGACVKSARAALRRIIELARA